MILRSLAASPSLVQFVHAYIVKQSFHDHWLGSTARTRELHLNDRSHGILHGILTMS